MRWFDVRREDLSSIRHIQRGLLGIGVELVSAHAALIAAGAEVYYGDMFVEVELKIRRYRKKPWKV